MNVFVLSAGRSGSLTFVKACEHISNFSAAHESRSKELGAARFDFPVNHIESDNRLSWLLGRLGAAYGENAFYVHLTRSRDETAKSFLNRFYSKGSIINAYHSVIIPGFKSDVHENALAYCLDYVDTVNRNIEEFLSGKPYVFRIELESPHEQFRRLWDAIGAEGDFEAACAEFSVKHHAALSPTINWSLLNYFEKRRGNLVMRVIYKLYRVVRNLPEYIRRA